MPGSRAAAGAGRRKRAQSRSPVTGAAESFESQAPRAGPLQPREPVQAEAQAAPAAQPAVTSWREGPAVLQPPSGQPEGVKKSTSTSPRLAPLGILYVITKEAAAFNRQYHLVGTANMDHKLG